MGDLCGISAKPWIPLDTLSEPEKELDPVLVSVMTPPKVRVPDILAVPPTSNLVSVLLPALMPRLPVVISKPDEEDAPAENCCNWVKVWATSMPARVWVPEGKVELVVLVVVRVNP